MEIRTCEEYVLNELENAQKEIKELKTQINSLNTLVSNLMTSVVEFKEATSSFIDYLEPKMKKLADRYDGYNGPEEYVDFQTSVTSFGYMDDKKCEQFKNIAFLFKNADAEKYKDIIEKIEEAVEHYEAENELKWEDR